MHDRNHCIYLEALLSCQSGLSSVFWSWSLSCCTRILTSKKDDPEPSRHYYIQSKKKAYSPHEVYLLLDESRRDATLNSVLSGPPNTFHEL